jgi:hypothetical protein
MEKKDRTRRGSEQMIDESELIGQAFAGSHDDPGAVDRARSRLLDAIHAEAVRRRWRRRLVLPAAATIAVVVAAAVVVAVVGPIGRSTAAAAELRHLAGIASSAQAPHLAEGEYLLVVSDELRPESTSDLGTGVSFTVDSRLRVKTWISTDGSSFRRTEWVSSEFASDADRRSWEEAGEPDIPQAGEVREERSRSGGYFWVDFSELPRDPTDLLAALRSGSVVPRSPGDDEVFLLIGELMAQGDAPSDLRAALFESAARLEGIEETGGVTDPLDRDGIGLAIDGASLRTQLVFDPDTADLLAIELYPIRADGSIGARRSWRAVHPAKVVDSSPQ